MTQCSLAYTDPVQNVLLWKPQPQSGCQRLNDLEMMLQN